MIRRNNILIQKKLRKILGIQPKHGLQNDKIDLSTVFYYLYRKILPLFTINCPLFFKMAKKAYFLSKISSIFSWAMSPMCNNVANVQHFFGDLRCCTLGASVVLGIWLNSTFEFYSNKVNI